MHAGNPEVSKNRRMMKPLATELEIPLWGGSKGCWEANCGESETNKHKRRWTIICWETVYGSEVYNVRFSFSIP